MNSAKQLVIVVALAAVVLVCGGCGRGDRGAPSAPTPSAAGTEVVTPAGLAENTPADVEAAKTAVARTVSPWIPASALERAPGGEAVPSGYRSGASRKPYKLVVLVGLPSDGDAGPPWAFTVVQPEPGAAWFLYQVDRGH
jgi:hypothetical protein